MKYEADDFSAIFLSREYDRQLEEVFFHQFTSCKHHMHRISERYSRYTQLVKEFPDGLFFSSRIYRVHRITERSISGSLVDARGCHSLSCKHGSERLARHHSINDLIHHALIRANIPSIKESKGLMRTDNKRPDGFTLIPWQAESDLTWDVSIVNAVAASYIQTTSLIAGGATEIASERKIVKYVELSNTFCFCPIILETFGPINDLGLSFLDELGRRIAIALEMRGKPHIYFSVFR